MNQQHKLLIVSDQPAITDQLRLTVEKPEVAVHVLEPGDVTLELDRLAPEVVVLVQPDDDSSIELIHYMKTLNPLAVVIFVARYQDFNLLRSVTRAGAVDFFVFPDELTLFEGRFPSLLHLVNEQKQQETEVAAAVSYKRGRGQIYSFYSGKGGVGRTIVASSFAQTLKLESTAQVILLDLNLQYGGVETVLTIESNRSLADLLPVAEEMNEGHIRNVSQKEKHSQLEILLSPADAEVAETIAEEFIAKLLRTCRRSYDFVIVDLPSHMNGVTYTALEESDKIYYVLNFNTLSLKVLKQVEQLFVRLGINTENRMEVVLNEVGRDNELQPNDLKQFVVYPVAAKIRRDLKGVQAALNKGESIRKQPNEKKIIPFAKDIQKWVLSMLK